MQTIALELATTTETGISIILPEIGLAHGIEQHQFSIGGWVRIGILRYHGGGCSHLHGGRGIGLGRGCGNSGGRLLVDRRCLLDGRCRHLALSRAGRIGTIIDGSLMSSGIVEQKSAAAEEQDRHSYQ